MLYRLIELWSRITAVFGRRRLDRDLQDEIAFHLAMRESDYADAGYNPSDARSAAERRFGNRTLLKEEIRDMWTFPPVESVLQDVRYAFRTLRNAPAFTIVATLTLSLGIGGTVTMFSLGRAASIESLPYPEPERLVQLWGTVQREQVERRGASYPDFVDWRDQATSFDDVVLVDSVTMTFTHSTAERVQMEGVSPPYFALLGVQPALGRTFHAGEDSGSASERVVILSDGLWQQRFGADRSVIGQSILLENRPFAIIGVMPPGFNGLTDTSQLWIPFTQSQAPATLTNRGTRGFVALARLKTGISVRQAQAELDAISARLEQAYPVTNEKRGVEVSSLEAELFGAFQPALRALTVAVALVLVMACVNVANLLLARSENRQREIALRSAIGASRSRVLRQLLTESCVLTGVGAVAGLAVAQGAIRALAATSPVLLPSFAQPTIDARAALVASALAVACGVSLGLAPAAHARVTRLADALKESVRGSSEGRRSGRVRGALIVAEVSLAVVLLVGAGLMIRSISNLTAIDPGFDARSLLTLRVSIPQSAAAAAATQGAASLSSNRALLERVRAVAGVRAASLASDIPLEGSTSAVFYAAEGQTEITVENRPRAYIHRVSPDFFTTMGIAMQAGRTFVDAEVVPDTPVVIVSDRLARRFWPAGDAVGKRIKLGDLQSDGPWREIIGIVSEVKYRGLPENPTGDPDIYFPILDAIRQLAVVVRTSLPPDAVAAPLRAAIQEWNAAVPVYNLTPLADLVAAQTAESRFTTWLMAMFAVLALALATVGIYGVMSYVVAQRTREIGIRLALGATTRQILNLVLGNGMRLIVTGVVLGVGGAVALRQLLAAQLFQVDPIDRSAFLAVALLTVVGMLACAIPALRATRLQAIEALHQE
jgi:putative ABC transport system permease protein